MNIAFWILIILIMAAIWYISVVIVVPLINIWLRKLDREINNEEKEIY